MKTFNIILFLLLPLKVENLENLFLRKTIPQKSENFKIGKVSWYGKEFHGKKTANGEIFNQYELTGASPNVTFGTFVEIINLKNNKKVIIRINDRGPFACWVNSKNKVIPFYPLKPHPERIFDLSKSAFFSLSDKNEGVLKVKYRFIN